LFIDNYDSFTHNLLQAFSVFEASIQVCQNDQVSAEEAIRHNPTHLVLGPGPRRPSEAGNLLAILEYFHDKIPVLGVCLGHQAIGKFFGAKVTKATKVQHGKKDWLHHQQSKLLKDLPNPLQIGRYHSLVLESLPSCLEIDAQASDGTIMAISHQDFPIFGVQFHPESILTPKGYLIFQRFLQIS
jgi:anthranilate synthase/aminodeoxychorismate synthase-like glutamine amidotransferase